MIAMDAVTIATAVLKTANSAWDVGSALYTLVQKTRVVDESVKSLALEATHLGNVCESVSKSLRGLPQGLDNEQAQLFSSIQLQLSERERGMSKLLKAIEGVRKEGSNFVIQTVIILQRFDMIYN